jgi:septal ring factor EnvC (AmiA/AmiB activator)
MKKKLLENIKNKMKRKILYEYFLSEYFPRLVPQRRVSPQAQRIQDINANNLQNKQARDDKASARMRFAKHLQQLYRAKTQLATQMTNGSVELNKKADEINKQRAQLSKSKNQELSDIDNQITTLRKQIP